VIHSNKLGCIGINSHNPTIYLHIHSRD